MSDDRPFPLGWSSWTASSGCEMNCVTRESVTAYSRVCKCFIFKALTNAYLDGQVIDSDTDAAVFEDYCKPCDGEPTKTEPCEPTCAEVLVSSGGSSQNTFTTNDFHHHRCCEESTAIRVMGTGYKNLIKIKQYDACTFYFLTLLSEKLFCKPTFIFWRVRIEV